ncbi:MAG: helix-turn-helix domain-containing protein [Acidobacteriota bacterium]
MTEDPIPNDIRQFILRSIDSIAQLEALLLLRANPQQTWDIHAIARRLYITEQETSMLLSGLSEQGLVAPGGESGQFAYQPASADLARMVDQVAEIYAKHLVPVTNLIHAKPRTRMQEFADAFRLRKDG